MIQANPNNTGKREPVTAVSFQFTIKAITKHEINVIQLMIIIATLWPIAVSIVCILLQEKWWQLLVIIITITKSPFREKECEFN